MNNIPNPQVIEMLRKALEQAERGEISSLVLLTMNGRKGHTGYGSRISSAEDAEDAPQHLKKLETDLREMLAEPV